MLFNPIIMKEFKKKGEINMENKEHHKMDRHKHHHDESMKHKRPEMGHKHHGNPLGFSHVGINQAHGIKK